MFSWLVGGTFAVLLLQADLARGTPPSCAILFCGVGAECAEPFNRVWLDAAQDEAVRVYHTINGGFVKGGCTFAPVDPDRFIAPLAVPTDTLICFDANTAPTTCAFKKCNYKDHPELFEDEPCVPAPDNSQNHKRSDLDKAACRPLSSWLAIAIAKLARAYELTEAGDFEQAASHACVAEYLFSQISLRITHLFTPVELTFINAFARQNHVYRHKAGPGQIALFDSVPLTANLRIVQSVRSCGTEEDAGVTSVLLYSSINDAAAVLTDTTQLLWAVSGTLAPFDTTLPPTNLCASEQLPTDQTDAFLAERRFPFLTPKDRAAVLADGAQRFYFDLRPTASAPVIVLAKDIKTKKALVTVAQLDFRNPFAEQTQLESVVIPAIFLRVADGDTCSDTGAIVLPPGTDVVDLPQTIAALSNSAPLTLEPGTSQCVGGERAGKLCTQRSECGAGNACRRKPFAPRTIAFCYDGLSWDETRPCAFADADDQCPFGECVGEASGLDGGAFPFLYFYKANNCSSTVAASELCAEPHVADWHAHPNVNAQSL